MVLFTFTMQSMAQGELTIIDQESKKPVPYANICFESLVHHSQSYGISSLEGKAINKAEELCVIAISFTGYKTLYDTIVPGQSKQYELEADLLNLNQVVVTATRSNKQLKNVPVITQVLLEEEIKSRGITEVGALLEAEIPGLEIHNHAWGSDIKMQGLDANYVLFLIDGERMAGETEGNVDYSRINMNDVERVEIVKGASSALYGSQAMGGVINIITKKPRDKVEFSMGGKYTQMNQVNFENLKTNEDFYFYKSKLDLPNTNLNATLGFNLNRFMSKTNFNRNTSDAYHLISTDSLYKEYEGLDLSDVELTEGKAPGTEDFSISQVFEYKLTNKWRLRANGGYYQQNRYDFIRDNSYDFFEEYNFGLKANYQISDINNLELSFNRDTYNKNKISEINDVITPEYSHYFYNPKAIYNQAIKEKHHLTLGAEYYAESLETLRFGNEDHLRRKNSNTLIAFAQDDFIVNSNFSIMGGFRMDHHSVYGTHVTPKLSAMYKWVPLTFRANYAMGFRSPTLKELYFDFTPAGLFVLKGNENLVPETNQYISLSTEYTRDKFNMSANFYKSWFENRIGGYWSINENSKQQYNYTNINQAELFGIEVLFRYRINRSFFMSGGYSYLNDSDEVDSKNVSAIAPHSGNFRFEYTLTKKIYQLKVNLSGKITGAKEYYELDDIEINGQIGVAAYFVRYEPFSIWNFSISQSFHNGILLVVGIDNILDYKAPIVSYNSNLSPGRIGFVSLNLNVDHLYREFSSLLSKKK